VTLIAAHDLVLLSPSHSGITNSFNFQTTAGLTNIVEFTPSLEPVQWQAVGTVVGDGTLKTFIDTNQTGPEGFYRILFQ